MLFAAIATMTITPMMPRTPSAASFPLRLGFFDLGPPAGGT
jgi:hypothetical protein